VNPALKYIRSTKGY